MHVYKVNRFCYRELSVAQLVGFLVVNLPTGVRVLDSALVLVFFRIYSRTGDIISVVGEILVDSDELVESAGSISRRCS